MRTYGVKEQTWNNCVLYLESISKETKEKIKSMPISVHLLLPNVCRGVPQLFFFFSFFVDKFINNTNTMMVHSQIPKVQNEL